MTKTLLISLIAVALSMLACETSEEGCLDIRAANFDVHAVNACDSCCVLPVARLDVDLSYDTLTFRFGTEYQLIDTEDTIRILSFSLPFSEFAFNSSSSRYQVKDTMLNVVPQTLDDYFIIESSAVETIGFTDFVDNINSVDCTVGYDKAKLASLQPFIDLHPTIRALEVTSRFYDDSLDVFFAAELSIEIADSVRLLRIPDIDNSSIQLEYEEPIELALGLPWTVPMNIDLRQMLVGIDPLQTNEMMAETIGANLSASISSN